MKIILVTLETPESEASRAYFELVRDALHNARVDDPVIEMRSTTALGELVFRRGTPFTDPGAIRRFDSTDLFVVAGRPVTSAVPWHPRFRQVLMLVYQCVRFERPLVCFGWGSLVLAHVLAIGNQFYRVLNHGGLGSDAQNADERWAASEEFKRREEEHKEGFGTMSQDAFLDDRSGDVYSMDASLGVWYPVSNAGMRRWDKYSVDAAAAGTAGKVPGGRSVADAVGSLAGDLSSSAAPRAGMGGNGAEQANSVMEGMLATTKKSRTSLPHLPTPKQSSTTQLDRGTVDLADKTLNPLERLQKGRGGTIDKHGRAIPASLQGDPYYSRQIQYDKTDHKGTTTVLRVHDSRPPTRTRKRELFLTTAHGGPVGDADPGSDVWVRLVPLAAADRTLRGVSGSRFEASSSSRWRVNDDLLGTRGSGALVSLVVEEGGVAARRGVLVFRAGLALGCLLSPFVRGELARSILANHVEVIVQLVERLGFVGTTSQGLMGADHGPTMPSISAPPPQSKSSSDAWIRHAEHARVEAAQKLRKSMHSAGLPRDRGVEGAFVLNKAPSALARQEEIKQKKAMQRAMQRAERHAQALRNPNVGSVEVPPSPVGWGSGMGFGKDEEEEEEGKEGGVGTRRRLRIRRSRPGHSSEESIPEAWSLAGRTKQVFDAEAAGTLRLREETKGVGSSAAMVPTAPRAGVRLWNDVAAGARDGMATLADPADVARSAGITVSPPKIRRSWTGRTADRKGVGKEARKRKEREYAQIRKKEWLRTAPRDVRVPTVQSASRLFTWRSAGLNSNRSNSSRSRRVDVVADEQEDEVASTVVFRADPSVKSTPVSRAIRSAGRHAPWDAHRKRLLAMADGDVIAAEKAALRERAAERMALYQSALARDHVPKPSPPKRIVDGVHTGSLARGALAGVRKIAALDVTERSSRGDTFYGSIRATVGEAYLSQYDRERLQDRDTRERFVGERPFDPTVSRAKTSTKAVQDIPPGLNTSPTTPYHDAPRPDVGPYRPVQKQKWVAQKDIDATIRPGSAPYPIGTPLFSPNLPLK